MEVKQHFVQGFVDKFHSLEAKIFGKNAIMDILPDMPEDDAKDPCNPLDDDCDFSLPEVDTEDPAADEEPLFEFGESDEGEFKIPDKDELEKPEEPENKVDIASMLGEEAPDEDDSLEMSFEVEGPPKPPNPFCEARQWLAAAM